MPIQGYRIVRELGRGGMATVYLAVQESLGREVALKLLSPQLASDPVAAERFLREGRIAAALQDRHIVGIYDIGVHAGQPYLAMEYMAGGAIAEALPQTASRALTIVHDIALALDHAHAEGVIHRDLKPENILQRKDGSFALGDFGIARTLNVEDASRSALTREGTTIGTPHYMSPEQLQGQPVDGRSDIYALGVVLFQLLTRQLPYRGSDEVPVGMQHVHAPVPRLPEDLRRYQTLIDAMMAKSPDVRPATGLELAKRIEALQTNGELAPTVPTLHPVARRPPRVPMRLLVALFSLLTAVVIWAVWTGSRPPLGHEPVAAVVADPIAEPSLSAQSVAVLPFTYTGGDAEQQYFADGIAEDLITTLSQYQDLKVIGRSSSFRFRNSQEGAQAIGEQLGVAYVIDGSVRRAGDEVRINVELVHADDGSTAWTRRFDRPLKGLFDIQDEIALAVAGVLQVRVLASMPGAVTTGRPASGNLDAYSVYLQATNYMSGAKDLTKAIELYEQATRLDPQYAQAWAWLGHSRTLRSLVTQRGEAAREAFRQAHTEIDTALRLQPNFGQAHAILANWLRTVNHDWNGAMAEFKIALPLVPDTDPSHGAYSILLTSLGRVNEAITERRKFVAGDPLAGYAHVYLARLQIALGQFDKAATELREAEKLDPESADRYANLGSEMAILKGDATSTIDLANRISGRQARARAVALALQIGNDKAAADGALQQQIEAADQSKTGRYAVARIHALRGDADKTFAWLQRDWEADRMAQGEILIDPLLLRFRDDPRFDVYCQRAGLPSGRTTEALSLDQMRARQSPQG
ncbi:MAG TPA: protein kinase [Chiayiivirga sp.]|nr:protein kinase [Chiayiivirga sp.]